VDHSTLHRSWCRVEVFFQNRTTNWRSREIAVRFKLIKLPELNEIN
jgi:hypothetical protein